MAEVLLVDDDLDVAEGMIGLLESRGHVVRHAPDGQAGLDALGARLPDVIVLDVEMPHVSGPEMAYRIVVHDAGMERIPILLLSGVTNVAEVARELGTPYFLGKPFPIRRFEQLLERALSERRPPTPTPR
jgi:CheY-like chemotaxis protein